ncbi:MAG: PQQ-binding-like beta-propeller repeat protein [Planctomycetales bacterium]
MSFVNALIFGFALIAIRLDYLSAQENWPQFRGPDGQGHSTAKNLPLNFDDKTNVTWKTPIPGRGLSSPVIWGNQIWLTTALEEGHSLHAICLDKTSGSVVHDIEVFTNKETIKVNIKNSHASPSPVIEEGRVYVHFGTYGSACLDTQTGQKIWENRDLKLDHQEGPGSSPVIFENLFIVNCDGRDVRYVVALNKNDGQIVWKKERPGKPNPTGDVNKSFCTPTLIQMDGQWQMIDPGAKYVVTYDPQDGKELWTANISGQESIPVLGRSPSDHRIGMTFICTGYMAGVVGDSSGGDGGRHRFARRMESEDCHSRESFAHSCRGRSVRRERWESCPAQGQDGEMVGAIG